MVDRDEEELEQLDEEILRRASPELQEMIRNMPVADRPRAAIHEAGHAVAAVKFGLPVTHALVEENEDGEWVGTTNVDLSLEEMVDWERENSNFLAFVYAGIVAQKKRGTAVDFGWTDDRARASRILAALDEDRATSKQRMHAAEEAARLFVERWWDTIEAVAEALLENNRLEGVQLLELVQES